jgi:hypothetical protein
VKDSSEELCLTARLHLWRYVLFSPLTGKKKGFAIFELVLNTRLTFCNSSFIFYHDKLYIYIFWLFQPLKQEFCFAILYLDFVSFWLLLSSPMSVLNLKTSSTHCHCCSWIARDHQMAKVTFHFFPLHYCDLWAQPIKWACTIKNKLPSSDLLPLTTSSSSNGMPTSIHAFSKRWGRVDHYGLQTLVTYWRNNNTSTRSNPTKTTPYLGTLMDQTANPMSLQELRHSDNIKSFK